MKKARREEKSSGTRGRPVARDFDELGKAVLSTAQLRYEAYVCTQWPYPSVDQQIDWAREAWASACRNRDAYGELTDKIVKLVRACYV
jgi:hypothetical protein